MLYVEHCLPVIATHFSMNFKSKDQPDPGSNSSSSYVMFWKLFNLSDWQITFQ
jgi:hypothetical protein